MTEHSQSKKPELATLYRRTEKAWRFRDIETGWGQFLLSHTVIAQTVMLGLLSLVASVRSTAVSQGLLITTFVLTAIVMGAALWIANGYRNLAKKRAEHFEESVRASESDEPIDNQKSGTTYEVEYHKFTRCRSKVFIGLWCALSVTFLILGYVIVWLPR